MEEEIESVTSSEWKLMHRRLDDLENLVKDMKMKLEILGECKCNHRNFYSENQHFDEEKTETGIGLNSESNFTLAVSGIPGTSGHSTIQSEILTLAGLDVNNTADSASSSSTNSSLRDSTSLCTAENGTPVSTKSTSRLSNGIGIQDLEKYRRPQVKLQRCDQIKVPGTLSFRIANNKSTLTHTNKESNTSSKKHQMLRRKGNGERGVLVSTPLLPHKTLFVCHFCSKRFDGKSNLTRRIRVHTGVKPFQCNSCSKTFTQNGNLRTHTRIHTGEKPFQCSFCSKKFSQSSSLTLHTRVHTGVKPFECGFCSKKFSRSDSLALHVRRHTGERPYTCQFCSKEFAVPSNLAVHMRVHTREKPYSCPFWPIVFARRNELQKHLNRQGETHHPRVQNHQEAVP